VEDQKGSGVDPKHHANGGRGKNRFVDDFGRRGGSARVTFSSFLRKERSVAAALFFFARAFTARCG
jgi:hypothetical protein